MTNNLINRGVILKYLNRKEIWTIIICIGLIIKISMFSVKLGDYNFYLKPWIDFIKNNGYCSSLKYNFYNYTPSYIYIFIALAKIGLNPLYSIKLVSILFEYLLAYFIGKTVCLNYKNNLILWITIAIVPLIPTLLINGALWGQCDSIYSAFVVGSIYFIFKKKQFKSILFLGLAFAFKIRTIFILPFYFVLLLRGKINWYYFLLIPLIYFISILPTWLYGRPLTELFTIYLSQSYYYQMLTIFFPNLYIWISDNYYQQVKYLGLLLAFLFTFSSCIYLSKKKFHFTFENYIKLAFLSVIITPFILPGMHERYLYLGDVMAVLYFFVVKKNIHLSLGIILVSFYSYLCCSRLQNILPLWPAFFIYLSIIVLTIRDLWKSLLDKPLQIIDK